MDKKIVYTYVVADLLHFGHLHYLMNAKSLAGKEGVLIVGVLTDEAAMEKKPRPCLSFDERMQLIQALKFVDCAVAQKEYSPVENIKTINPDILVESSSHSKQDLSEVRKVSESVSCRVIVMPYYPNQSSTCIKTNIKDNWDNQEVKFQNEKSDES